MIRLDAAIAFVRKSGALFLENEIIQFSKNKSIRIVVGLDFRMTSYEALDTLLMTVKENTSIYAYKSRGNDCFHPKIYLFTGKKNATLVVGSANLTQSGMATNQEAILALSINPELGNDKKLYDKVIADIDSWTSLDNPCSRLLTVELLRKMGQSGDIISEQEIIAKRVNNSQSSIIFSEADYGR